MSLNWDWKSPPDAPVLTGFDRAVLWLHNIGIQRKWVLRAYVGALVLASTTLQGIQGRYLAIPFITVCLIGVLAVEEWKMGSLGARLYNASVEYSRVGEAGWMRFGFIVLIAIQTLLNFPFNLDSPFWCINLWLLYTYAPAEPPKHKLKDVLRSISPLQPATGAA